MDKVQWERHAMLLPIELFPSRSDMRCAITTTTANRNRSSLYDTYRMFGLRISEDGEKGGVVGKRGRRHRVQSGSSGFFCFRLGMMCREGGDAIIVDRKGT